MSDPNANNKWQRMSAPIAIIFALTLMLSVFTFIGAVILRNQSGHLPEGAIFANAELLRSSVFALGLSMGLFGSAGLLAAPRSWRPLISSTILFAFGQIILAFIAKDFITQRAMGHNASPVVLLIPSAFFVCAVVGIFRTMFKQGREKTPATSPTEEPQQTLSQL